MSRAFMPWYIGDYLRDTGHLNTEQHGAYLLLLGHCWQHGAIPASAAERAAIAKLPVNHWNKIKAPIERFFDADGTQKRVIKEIARTERAVMQRRIAGKKGGDHSATARAILRARALASAEAEAKRNPSGRLSESQASGSPNSEQPSTNHIEYITNTSSVAASAEEIPADQSAGLLATAPPAGALARPPSTEPTDRPKPVSALTREELEESFTRRKASK